MDVNSIFPTKSVSSPENKTTQTNKRPNSNEKPKKEAKDFRTEGAVDDRIVRFSAPNGKSRAQVIAKMNELRKGNPEKVKVPQKRMGMPGALADNQIDKPKEKPAEMALERPSEVGLNDPNDPATIGKLKSLVSTDAFNFNPKERDVLSKIIAQ